MKIVSWNINGIRATKAGVKGVLDSLEADIICLQETKVTPTFRIYRMLNSLLTGDLLDEPTAVVDGYNSYFSFSRGRSGYSGVATFCRDSATPVAAEEGLSGLLTSHAGAVGQYGEVEDFTQDDLLALDNEGRTVITCHKIQTHDGREESLTVINVYCPRADPEKPERKDFKLRFYRLLQARAEAVLAAGSRVIVLGDVNTSHRTIDTCDPQDPEFFEEHPGRKWLNQFLVRCDTVPPCSEVLEAEDEDDAEGETGGLFLDSFRFFHPAQKNAFTCWCTTTGARQTNYGTRIDYIFGDRSLVEQEFEDSVLMADVEGSDHCPIKAVLKCMLVRAPRCPPFCTKYLPEFAGRQQKLSHFLVKVDRRAENGLVVSDSQFGLQESSKVPEKQVKLGQKHGRVETTKKGSKKQKTDISKGQGSLMSFFRPTKGGVEKATEAMKDSDKREHCTAEGNLTRGPKEVQAEVGVAEATAEPPLLQTENCTVTQEVRAAVGAVGRQAKPQADFWKSVLKGPAPPPICKGHSEPCVLRTVKKEGPNCGKQFYVCARPEGHASNPEARCNFFLWVTKKTSLNSR